MQLFETFHLDGSFLCVSFDEDNGKYADVIAGKETQSSYFIFHKACKAILIFRFVMHLRSEFFETKKETWKVTIGENVGMNFWDLYTGWGSKAKAFQLSRFVPKTHFVAQKKTLYEFMFPAVLFANSVCEGNYVINPMHRILPRGSRKKNILLLKSQQFRECVKLFLYINSFFLLLWVLRRSRYESLHRLINFRCFWKAACTSNIS